MEFWKIWFGFRFDLINFNKVNKFCFEVVEFVFFIVCLDDVGFEDMVEFCLNFLCGGYKFEGGV